MNLKQGSGPVPHLVTSHLYTEQFSVMRATNANPDPRRIMDIPCADAFSVIVQLQDFSAHRLWHGRRLSYSGGYRQGAVSIPYMGDELRCQHRAAYDNLRFNIPRQTLDELQAERGGQRITAFDYEQGTQDAVMYHLACAILPALQYPSGANQLFVDHVLLAISAHAAERYGKQVPPVEKSNCGLALWQERRAKELIANHLADGVSVARIAEECALSRSHFSRAFKQSTGMAPHAWLSYMRIEKAKEMLTSRQHCLSQIALECGFADQAHFTRSFSRMVGATPSAWCRMRPRSRESG